MALKPDHIEQYKEHYSDDRFWKKIADAAKKAGIKLVYICLLLYYVLKNPSLKTADKAKIYGALGYFILPIDLIPDMVPYLGYTDDISALLLALFAVWKNVTPEIKQQAKDKLHQWFGDYDDSAIDLGIDEQ